MGPFLRPLHLLLFGRPFAYDLIDRRFHKARRYSLLIAPTFAVIRNERLVHHDVCVELVERFSELLTALAIHAPEIPKSVRRKLVGCVTSQPFFSAMGADLLNRGSVV